MPDTGEARWYVVHTYSGYEDKVASNIMRVVENRGLQDMIQAVNVPTEMVTEIKDEKQREVRRKVFPGYVLVKMIYTNETWYIVRNTRGCTGFVGAYDDSEKSESKLTPLPLSDEEIQRLGLEGGSTSVELPYEVGDSVKIVNGPFEGFIAVVNAIDTVKGVVRVTGNFMFNRESSAEIDLVDVVPLN